jgi:polar amino acid transport system permease protein
MNYHFNFDVILDNFDTLLLGLGYGLYLAFVSLLIGMMIGLVSAFMAISNSGFLKSASRWYVTILRNTPLLVLIYLVYFGLPDIGIRFNKEMSFIFTLAFYAGAYMSEVFRAGLQSIEKGIIEAGQSIGLTRIQIGLHIQLPIMFRKVLPSMSNYLISLFKDTALAASITVHELTYFARKINTETFRVFEAWLSAAALYIFTCYMISFILRKIEIKLTVHGRGM